MGKPGSYVPVVDYELLKQAAEDAFDAYDAWRRLGDHSLGAEDQKARVVLDEAMTALGGFFGHPKAQDHPPQRNERNMSKAHKVFVEWSVAPIPQPVWQVTARCGDAEKTIYSEHLVKAVGWSVMSAIGQSGDYEGPYDGSEEFHEQAPPDLAADIAAGRDPDDEGS